jgi:hypothetical protein
MNATVISNEIVVTLHTVRESDQTEWIRFDVPNGWDDVKKVCKKVLSYDGKKFFFASWNSDDLYCYFNRPVGPDVLTAKIARK